MMRKTPAFRPLWQRRRRHSAQSKQNRRRRERKHEKRTNTNARLRQHWRYVIIVVSQSRISSRCFGQSRKIHVVPKASSGAPNEPPPIHFDADNPASLVLPVFFLYPQHATSDLISEFHEDTTFGDHLSAMFPPSGSRPDWDAKGEYTLDNLTVYAASRTHRLFRIGRDKTLKDAMAAPQKKGQSSEPSEDGLEIREGCLSFVVLPRGAEEKKWVDNYKREHPPPAR